MTLAHCSAATKCLNSFTETYYIILHQNIHNEMNQYGVSSLILPLDKETK